MVTHTVRNLALDLALALVVIAGIGLIAIGVSGVVAAGFGRAFGMDFVAGDPPDVTYTPDRCADLAEYHPEARGCHAAAAAHHFDEIVDDRIAAGGLGLPILAATFLIRRRYPTFARQSSLPDTFSGTVGASLFGIAALLLTGPSLLGLLFGQSAGAGGLLSGGVVSLVVFVAYATTLFRALLAHSWAVAANES